VRPAHVAVHMGRYAHQSNSQPRVGVRSIANCALAAAASIWSTIEEQKKKKGRDSKASLGIIYLVSPSFRLSTRSPSDGRRSRRQATRS
jgi:hypothetical protein